MATTTKPFVLITAPHALQPRGRRERASDLSARETARELNRALHEASVPTVKLEGDVIRDRCDLNRAGTCPLGEFQQAFDMALARRPAYLVDVHSYPAVVRWRLPTRVSAVVLYNDAEQRAEADALVAALADANVLAATVAGEPDVNYLLVRARAKRVPAVLLEVNESRSSEEHTRIARIVAQHVKRRLSTLL